MSDIRSILQSALKDLDSSVDRIEKAAGQKLQNAKESQHDLFSAGAAHVANTNDTHNVDPAAVARKLDKAISRVEQLLKEG